MSKGRIVFIKSSFGNCSGDVVNVTEDDETSYYYYDGFKRWCYVDKSDKSILFIPKGKRLVWKEIEHLLM